MSHLPPKTLFRSSALLLAATAALQAVPAAAVVHIVNLTGTASNATTSSFTIGNNVYFTGNLVLDPFDEFTVEEGDELDITLTLFGGFTVPASMEQLFGLNFYRDDGIEPIITAGQFETTTSGTGVFSYSMGPTGLPNNTQGGACGNCLTAIMGQIPGNAFTFDGLKLTQKIEKLGGPYTINQSSFSYQLRELTSVVPEPATWAMMILGFGLTGGALRNRKAKIGYRPANA